MAACGISRLGQASYRGVEFYAESYAVKGGRRYEHHEFPSLDSGFFEDLGRKDREIAVEGFVIASDRLMRARRDNLTIAFEAPGPGLLSLPWLTRRFDAVCEDYSLKEIHTERRKLAISATFKLVVGGKAPAGVKSDLLEEPITALNASFDASLARMRLQGIPSWVDAATRKALSDAAAAINVARLALPFVKGQRSVGDFIFREVARAAQTLAPEAFRFASAIRSMAGALASEGAPEPRRSAQIIARQMRPYALERKPPPGLSTWTGVGHRNSVIVDQVARRASFAAAARMIADDAPALAFRGQAEAARQLVAGWADQEIERSSVDRDDVATQALMRLKTATIEVIDARARELGDLKAIVLREPRPALVVMWEAAERPDLWRDFCRANGIINPWLCPAGVPLQLPPL